MGLKDVVVGLNSDKIHEIVTMVRAAGREDLAVYLQTLSDMANQVNPITVEITASRVIDMLTDFQQPAKVERFTAAVNTFLKSSKTSEDYVILLKTFESCCGTWTWDEIQMIISQVIASQV